jgi:hypothetical protein
LSRRNYASKTLKLESPQKGTTATVDQKYEKVGTLTSRTAEFEADEQRLRTLISDQNMLIQFEQRSGLPGNRTLNMALGVIPGKFDQVIASIQEIGTLTSIHIDKSDKTNEYKELEAKRHALEKTREALSALKGQGGSVKELIDLENRILDIENQIQAFGVRLGEFDEENEFCTVKFTLTETQKPGKIPFPQRVKVAFEWTVRYYLSLCMIIFLGTLSVFLVVSTLQKKRWLQQRIATLISESDTQEPKDE